MRKSPGQSARTRCCASIPDDSVGYEYPQSYIKAFGADYRPDAYVEEDYQRMRDHKWYMSGRMITVHDIYSFDPDVHVELEEFTDVIGREFRQPEQGPGVRQQPGGAYVASADPAGEVSVILACHCELVSGLGADPGPDETAADGAPRGSPSRKGRGRACSLPGAKRRSNDGSQRSSPHSIALRSSVMNSALSHDPWNVAGTVSISARSPRISGLWQWPSAKYVTPPLPICFV